MAALSKRDIEMIFRAETDAATRPVNELTKDVKTLRKTMEDLSAASGKTEKQLADLGKATRDLEKAQQELGTARTLLTQLNAQATALERAEAAAEKAGKKYNDLKTQVDGAEQPTKRLTTSLAAAERGLAANNAKLDEARKNYAEVKGSIEGIIGPVSNLDDAFRQVAVAQRDITQGLAVAKGSVAGFKTEIEQTRVEADRLTSVDAFRKLAADSVAAVSAVERINTATAQGATSATRLVDAIQGLINPAAAAAVQMDGIDNKLDGVINKLNGGKLTAAEWGHLNNELVSIQSNLIRAAAEVDKFTSQQSRVDNASAAYEAQAAKVRALAAAEITASTDVEALTADLQREEAALRKLGGALDSETIKLNEFGTALKRIGVDSTAIPAALERIENTAKRAAPAIKKVADTVSPGGKGGFLGLKPYELQNLGYQVNDVFTSLGSGAPPMQVFAQQAGQIVQIFPGLISGFVRFLPVIAPIAAALIVFTGALSEANTELQQTKEIQSTLDSLGSTNGFDPAKVKEIVSAFRDMGVSADDALASTKTFVKEGLNPAAVDDYVVAAKNLADVQGIDVKQATEELTSAFTAGADEVLKLDDKYGFLTDAQRDNILASKDTKDEHNQVNKAFTALYSKMQIAANDMRGPFTDSTNTLRQAWRDLMTTFADTGIIDSVNVAIANAITGFSYLINLAKRVAQIGSQRGRDAFLNPGKNAGQKSAFALAEADTFAQMAKSRKQFTQGQKAPGVDAGAGSAGRQKENEKQYTKDRKQAAKDAKKAASDAKAEAKRREAEAKRLAKQYANEQDQLAASLSRFTAEAMKGQQAPLAAQLELANQAVDEQFKALEDRLSEFKDKFGADAKINGVSQADYAASLAAQKSQIKLNKELGVYESNINDLLKERDTRLKSIKEEQDAGLIGAQQALNKTREVTSDMGPKIDAAVASARAFIAALTPSAQTSALLAKFDSIASRQGGGIDERKSAASGLTAEDQKVNDIFARRAALIEAANRLYDLGVDSFDTREAKVKSAYDLTNQALVDQIAAMQVFVDTNKELFPPEMYEKALADLQAYNAELKHTDTLTQNIRQSAEQAIAGGLMNMFDTLAQGIANIVTGAGDLGDVFESLGTAALNMAATFMKAVAEAIIQIYALKAAKAIIGMFHGGGTVGSYGNGVMSRSVSMGPSLASVPRYHNGTQGAGLKSNEMLAVLQKGEKVQTEEQQRLEGNRLKAAREGGGKGAGLRQILAIGDQEIASAMSGSAGDDVHFTWLRRNKTTIKQMLGQSQ